jgi:hypothetical protein
VVPAFRRHPTVSGAIGGVPVVTSLAVDEKALGFPLFQEKDATGRSLQQSVHSAQDTKIIRVAGKSQ